MIKIYISLLILISSSHIIAKDEYLIKAGDIIKIHLYDDKEVNVTAKIDTSETVNFPFIGDVNVSKKTTKEIENLITEKLKDGYFINPEVHVSIIEYRPFYINGQVKKPGGFPYQPNITVSMSIALAGGLTDRASNSDWYIKKPGGEKTKVTGESYIYPGDILIIERSFF
ncbi:polysaccharide biosynthesis/export family protein [Marinomonas posidonica]|uniref:Polysaccharide export protein n=1 Tax=Marinomonas posidonica (strain CECT 7376 / NCIMB 14433 / IVIA-Po-181) TaxID=491952 RepID=F6CRM5_MARPP|nr:polysaccharide biosynthesis/export family protein [Marinomonas posidonica]AEF53788.1 polysaccharide export protein [Marinomonas posidonica IVIA-Po-181]